jgi:hypothetical protein
MKKLILLPLFFCGLNAFTQVTKSDFENLFSTFPQTGYEYVYLSNVSEFYTDGSSKYIQNKYFGNKMTMEAKETGVYLKFYTDESKSSCNDIQIVPYKSIEWIEGFKTGFIISLMK